MALEIIFVEPAVLAYIWKNCQKHWKKTMEHNEELEKGKEKLKSFVLQYVLICKLIVKYKPMLDCPTKTIQETIKCEKLVKAFHGSISDLIREFENYFNLERKYNAPVNLTFRSSYKKLKSNRDRVV